MGHQVLSQEDANAYVAERPSTLTSYPTDQKTGHTLASWAVYQHVALRQSFADIALSINDIFGYCLQLARSDSVLRLAWLRFTGSLWIRC